MSMTNRARKTSKTKQPSESRGDDETWGWVCPGCNEPSIDIIKCDMCFKWACYSCQDVTTDITRTLEKLGNVGIKWRCVICRERGERDSAEQIIDNVYYEATLTDERVAKTIATVNELSKKMDIIINGGEVQNRLLEEVQNKVMQQTENVKKSFAQAVANPTNAPTPPMTEFKGIMLEAMTDQSVRMPKANAEAKM